MLPKRNTFILIFAMLLVLSVFALSGCSNKTPAPTATPAATEAPAEPTAAEPVTEQPEAPAETPETEAEPVTEQPETPAEAPETEAEAVTEQPETLAEAPEAEAEPVSEQPETPAEAPEAEAAPSSNAVASVDGQEITVESFKELATFNRYQYLNMYNQYAQMYMMYGVPLDSLNEQVSGLLGDEGKEALGLEVIDQLTYDKVLDLEAEKRGLEISDEEVMTQLKMMFGYEDEAESEEPVLGMDTFNVDADETDDTADKDAEFRAFAETVLLDSYDGAVSFDYLKNYARHILIDNTLFEEELAGRVFEEEQVNARHILVEDEESAKAILEKLEAGESWDALASEHSLDTSNKDNSGSLGWFGRGMMVSEFEDAAFALEPGQISEPVQTAYGYHIIASDGKEVRPLEGDALAAAQDAAYEEWAIGLRSAHDIQSFEEVWLDAVPTEPVFEPMTAETQPDDTAESEAAAEPEAELPETETETEGTAVEEAAAEPEAESTEPETAVEETAGEPAAEQEAESAEPEAAVTEETAGEPAAEAETESTEAEAAVAEETAAEPAPEAEAAADETADEPIIATVDGEPVSNDEFVQSAVFSRYQYLNSYNQYAQMYRSYGIPLDSLNEQVEGILGVNAKERLGSEIIDELTYYKVLELEAEKAGIEVTEEEVYDRLKTMFGYEEPSAADNVMLGQEIVNVDPTITDDAADKNAEFEAYANNILALGYDSNVSLDYLKGYAKHIILDNKLFDEELATRVFEAEQVNARHILVETEETANEVLERLNAGEDWNDLAAEYNIDSGTSLGWFGRGTMVSEFEEAAFALEPGEISAPVKTQYGYHIIASDGKEMRPLEGNALQTAQNEVYTEWTAGLRESHDIQDHPEVWMELVPTEPAFTPIVVPTAEETVTEEATAEEAAEETVTEEPAAEEPEAEETVTEEATAEEAAAEETVTEEPAGEEPAAEETVTEEAAAEEAEAAEEETPAQPSIRVHAVSKDDAETEGTEWKPVVKMTLPAAEEETAEEAAAEETAETGVPAEAPEAEAAVETVGTVNGEPISAEDFVNAAIFNRYQLISQYQQNAQMYAMFGLPLDDINAAYENYLGTGEESKRTFGQETFNNLVLFKAAELEAAEKGVEISDSTLTERMKEIFGYTDAQAETESALGLDSFNIGEEETSAEEDPEFRATVDSTLAMAFDGNISYDYFKEYVRHDMLLDALFEKEIEGRTFESEQVNARHILVEDEETARDILSQLAGGADWNDLASEHSLDTANKDNGGALGWFGRGTMVSEFEDAAFTLEPGQISRPVKTPFGYHIIASDGKEVRPLEDEALETAKQEAFSEWYKALPEKYEAVSDEEAWMQIVPETPVFEPITTEAAADAIPTYSIGSDTDEDEEDEAELSITSTEQDDTALSLDNTEQDDDGALSLDNTEQDDGTQLLDNAAENEAPVNGGADDEEITTINNSEQDEDAFLLDNEAEIG